ncbi:NAD(P)/FAD-dependent oxidoreductase [Variovorax ginsengisoli]|uniref:FAD-dependent oxidoreductase n=1 Tax=Variovorax ginsengisoli TaxID=363844 RepID=A0ABT8S747_9BURK|nr:FAD-dependent oxidoreductase [Variovorax ginsengisoli]MDN8615118.1 FAD-dependent oxidoreductase [Variovorax ginsengisoli]MDO1534288.1 FAD-dependent oxidoreductase [Variovorax ginsengisoli]
MACDVLVLGAGMVGTCTALQLARRGHSVALVDRRPPGRETSYGNAGIIQREAVEPYAFPREWASVFDVAFKRGIDVNYHFSALPAVLPRLARYWHASAPARYAPIAQAYSRLIEHCLTEHQALMDESGAGDLVRKEGYHFAFRTPAAMEQAVARAADLARRYGVRHALLDSDALARAEPGLRRPMAGALHWLDPWSVNDPGALVARYARRFAELGGQVVEADASGLRPVGGGWQVQTAAGPLAARHAVVALGPWADPLIAPLGYRLPLFVKRGYHRHYRGGPGLRLPLLDAERGLVLAPMAQGMRITTGAEFARIGAPATPVQLDKAEAAARELLDLPQPVEPEPWMGNRPCTVDMKPVIGPAPQHPGLWFNFGHAHQGFTLGPVSGRLLAEMIEGSPPVVDPAPYSAARF